MNNKQIWEVIKWPVVFVVILWIIEGLSEYFNYRVIWLGIIPRTISGIPGIFFSPYIHGNFDHLLSNTLPLLVVGSGLFYFYKEIAWRVITMVWLFTGFWVWLAARQNAHIGASGLIYGFVCFLFLSGIIRKDTRLLAVSLLVTFLYGGMVWGILPVDQTISWESHLFGSIAGIFCAIYFRHNGPQRQKTQWEIEEEMELALEKENQNKELKDDDLTNQASPDFRINYELIIKKPESDNKDLPEKEG